MYSHSYIIIAQTLTLILASIGYAHPNPNINNLSPPNKPSIEQRADNIPGVYICSDKGWSGTCSHEIKPLGGSDEYCNYIGNTVIDSAAFSFGPDPGITCAIFRPVMSLEYPGSADLTQFGLDGGVLSYLCNWNVNNKERSATSADEISEHEKRHEDTTSESPVDEVNLHPHEACVDTTTTILEEKKSHPGEYTCDNENRGGTCAHKLQDFGICIFDLNTDAGSDEVCLLYK
ncbi:MAG: hypothetical protein M1834_008575 [Cirrosporium novae-zelandiae]|nr:MAG: hypothetical protein M1834_008575 [Cirrosporium novae-zelandiae]